MAKICSLIGIFHNTESSVTSQSTYHIHKHRLVWVLMVHDCSLMKEIWSSVAWILWNDMRKQIQSFSFFNDLIQFTMQCNENYIFKLFIWIGKIICFNTKCWTPCSLNFDLIWCYINWCKIKNKCKLTQSYWHSSMLSHPNTHLHHSKCLDGCFIISDMITNGFLTKICYNGKNSHPCMQFYVYTMSKNGKCQNLSESSSVAPYTYRISDYKCVRLPHHQHLTSITICPSHIYNISIKGVTHTFLLDHILDESCNEEG